MSLKSLGIAILLFVGSIMLAFMIHVQMYGSPFERSVELSARTPSSTQSVHLKSVKQETLNPIHHHGHKHTQKLKGPANISIESSLTGAAEVGQVFRLRLNFHSDVELDTVTFKWSIPEGIDVIYGNTEGEIHNLIPGEQQFVEIDLRSNTTENLQIHGHMQSQHGALSFSEVAQFNTVFEHQLNPSKSESLETTSDEDSSLQFKVFE